MQLIFCNCKKILFFSRTWNRVHFSTEAKSWHFLFEGGLWKFFHSLCFQDEVGGNTVLRQLQIYWLLTSPCTYSKCIPLENTKDKYCVKTLRPERDDWHFFCKINEQKLCMPVSRTYLHIQYPTLRPNEHFPWLIEKGRFFRYSIENLDKRGSCLLWPILCVCSRGWNFSGMVSSVWSWDEWNDSLLD